MTLNATIRAAAAALSLIVPPVGIAQSSVNAAPEASESAPERDAANVVAPFSILGTEVLPGTRRQLRWTANHHFAGVAAPTPVLVAHGNEPGPALCLTAAIHGDELNGIEIVRRVLYTVDPAQLRGTVIGVPIVNLAGFQNNSRYLPDRRDLNRAFPGDPRGSLAARTAHSLFNQVIRHCDRLVDLHTGSFHRSNLVQLRGDLNSPEILAMSRAFGAIAVLQSSGIRGSLRHAASKRGIPSVTLEVGEPMRLQSEEVDTGVRGIRTLMDHMGMQSSDWSWTRKQPVYYRSHWLRADQGGILFSVVKLGDRVKPGDLLATVTDPVTNERSEIRSRANGRVLGMALNQVVMPGFAAFHIGVESSEKEVADEPPGEAETPLSEDVDTTEDPPEPAPEAAAAESEAEPEDLPDHTEMD